MTEAQLEAMRQLVLAQADFMLGIAEGLAKENVAMVADRKQFEAWRATLEGKPEHPSTSPTSDAAERLYLAVEEAQRVAVEQRVGGYCMIESTRWKAVEAAWHDLRRERSGK